MEFSVIVLNWNGREHLGTCFGALAAQTFRDFETIFVDNGSSDNSIEYMRREFPWVRVVVLENNRGFSGGNAAGVAIAEGRAIVLLNNDTRPEPDWLEMLSRCAQLQPGVGMIASHLTDWDGLKTDSAGDGCRVTGRGFGRHRGFAAATAPASGPVFGACGGAAFYRRELIEDIGFLDEDFFLGFEDSDFAFRAQLRGWSAWFCREAVVRHRMSATQGNWTEINVYHGARNHLWVCIKNMPGRLLALYGPLMVGEVLAMAMAACLRGRGWAYLRGVGAGFRGIPGMWRKRRSVQCGRRLSQAALAGKLDGLRFTSRGLRRMLGAKE